MNLARLIKPELIRLELETVMPSEPEDPHNHERFLWSIKEDVLGELTDLLASGGRVGNLNRLRTDLINREKKASTGIGRGLAIPHVRTREAREFTMAFARSTPGIAFDAIDQEPAHLFFTFIAPPYDDTLYLKIYKQLAEAFTFSDVAAAFMAAEDEGEILRTLKQL